MTPLLLIIHFVKTHDLTVDPSKVDESFVSQEIQKLLKLELMKEIVVVMETQLGWTPFFRG